MYCYESSATLTTDRLHYKLQTRTLVREGAPKLHYKLQTRTLVREDAPKRRAMQFSDKRKENVKSGYGPQREAPLEDILTDWPSVVK
jgi:hypothetical protein